MLKAWNEEKDKHANCKVKIHAQEGYEPVLPLAVPNLKEVRSLANHLHALGASWQGEIFGWQAEYTPRKRTKAQRLPIRGRYFRPNEKKG